MGESKFKDEIEFRKMQEAVSTLLAVKNEYAKALYEMYIAYTNAGFSKKEAMELVKTFMLGK